MAPGEHVTDLKVVLSEIGRVHGTVRGLADGETATIGVAGTFTRVESDGAFEVHGVPIGEHVAKCSVRLERKFLRRVSRTIVMDETMEARIDFVLGGKALLLGRVTAGGQPIPMVEVRAEPVDETHAWSHATTNRDGTYVIEGLNEGDYQVILTSRGVREKVTVAGETPLDFELGTSELSGHVKSSASVLGIRLSLSGYAKDRAWVNVSTTVDASGFYRFSGIPNGRYTLKVANDRFEKYSREVRIRRAVYDFDIVLEPTKEDKLEQDLETLEVLGF